MSRSTARSISFVLAFILGLYVAAAYHTRPLSDDYCNANVAFEHGIISAIEVWYINWTGRFSQIALASVLAYLGPASSPIATIGTIFGLLFAGWYAVKPLSRFSFLLSMTVVAALLTMLPNLPESLFWQIGSITYFTPLIGFGLLCGLVIRQQYPLLIFVIAFITSGFNEIAAVGLLCMPLGMVVMSSSYRRFLLPIIVAAVIGLIVMVASPGNSTRATIFETRPMLLETVLQAFVTSVENTFSLAIRGLIPLLLMGFTARSILRPPTLTRVQKLKFGAISVAGYIALTTAMVFPAIWGMGYLVDRAATAIALIFEVEVILLFILFARGTYRQWVTSIILLGTLIQAGLPLPQYLADQLASAYFFDRGAHHLLERNAYSLACYQKWLEYRNVS